MSRRISAHNARVPIDIKEYQPLNKYATIFASAPTLSHQTVLHINCRIPRAVCHGGTKGPKSQVQRSEDRQGVGSKMTTVARLPTGCHAQNTPIPFRAVSLVVVLLPHVVKRGIQDRVSGKTLLDTRDCRLLFFRTGLGDAMFLTRETVSNDPCILEEQ